MPLVCCDAMTGRVRQVGNAAVFKEKPEAFRVVVGDIGGGFGMKTGLTPEDALVCYAARKLGRPVRWRGERAEEFLAAHMGRDQHFEARKSCPNMTLYPAKEFHGQVTRANTKGATVIVANQPVHLADLFLRYPGHDIVWIACRALELKRTGAATGVNRVGR